MADISSSLSLPFILPSQAQKHVTHNEALRILDVVTQLGVASDDLATPPVSPSEGARYIIDTGAGADWTGHDGEVALYETASWQFFVPRAGWRAYVINRDAMVVYDGEEWVDLESPELEDIETFGLGMSTLPGSPFSAKINAALWTALYTADGGDGDIITKINKETSGNNGGFVFQDNFESRALFGLFGTNDLRLTTSADGSTFRDGLVVGAATGIVEQPQLPRFKGVTNYDNYCAADVWTRIAINDLAYNEQGSFDAVANEFTAPVGGTYAFGALLTFKEDTGTNSRMGAQLVINGATVVPGSQVSNTGPHLSEVTTLGLNTIAVLSAGDTVELQGVMRDEAGYFMADRTDFWAFKIG